MRLTEKFKIESREQAQRKSFVRLTLDDITLLRELLPIFEVEVDGIVEQFYEHMLRHPEAQKFFNDEAMLRRVKASQRGYLLELFQGDFGEDYFEKRLQIGVVHERIGLTPKWYIGGNSNFLCMMLPLLMRKYRWKSEKLTGSICALIKIMNLDQQLIIDTYIGS
ncbi:MAG: protoglobin domain-containing protein, partial [Methylophilaceae bacterium]